MTASMSESPMAAKAGICWVGQLRRCATSAGLLGKTQQDGRSDGKPLPWLIPHLIAALAKPAADERLIFIDRNAKPQVADTTR
jgi:hypothetical protein